MKLLSLIAPLAMLVALAAPSAAQCFPDNLDQPGGSCQGTFTQVPQRGFNQQALGICWQNCGTSSTGNYLAQWGALNPIGGNAGTPPSCGWYQARLRLTNSSGLAWQGTMHFSYSRTWMESNTAGSATQVWRYLVNGDLTPFNTTAMPCGVPPCAAPNGNLVRFTGYVDYAYDCGSTITERAWMLTHACDAIDHASGFPRAGVFHPNQYYSFVGPAAGFVVGVGGTLEAGAAGLECVRKWDAFALPARCTIEEPLVFAQINPNVMTCMCGTGPASWYEGQLSLAGVAGSTLTPFPGSDPFRSFPVGMWTNPAAFPGVEEVRWNCNEGQYGDCMLLSRQEYYFGVTTAGGNPAFSFNTNSPSTPLSSTFVDQSNSVLLPANIATRNRPYRSDHILNLNF